LNLLNEQRRRPRFMRGCLLEGIADRHWAPRDGLRDNYCTTLADTTPLPPAEITSEKDLLSPTGAAPGTMPTDLEQSTGLERLEILGKMQGVDVFDMSPLDASRKGTYTWEMG
jgi:hypothetical protein